MRDAGKQEGERDHGEEDADHGEAAPRVPELDAVVARVFAKEECHDGERRDPEEEKRGGEEPERSARRPSDIPIPPGPAAYAPR